MQTHERVLCLGSSCQECVNAGAVLLRHAVLQAGLCSLAAPLRTGLVWCHWTVAGGGRIHCTACIHGWHVEQALVQPHTVVAEVAAGMVGWPDMYSGCFEGIPSCPEELLPLWHCQACPLGVDAQPVTRPRRIELQGPVTGFSAAAAMLWPGRV